MARASGVTGGVEHCGCGCGSMIAGSKAVDPCGCGCSSNEPETARTPEQEVSDLQALRSEIDRRLAELAS